jgi:LysM repeat protein
VRTYEYHHLLATGDSPGGNYTHTYTTTYEARDSYLEKSVTGTSNDTNYKATTTSSTYDTMGRRVALTQTTPISGQSPLTYLRYFSYDAEGGILTRRDGTLENGVFTAGENAVQHYTYVNGQQVAALGEDGKIDAASQLTAFDSSEQGAEPTLVMEGDTLQSIAQRVYGNPSLWYVLAAANAVSDADLVAGTTLKAPEVKTTANDASTFKPFDPSSIEGPTTPSLPYITPPPKHHCNALATVLMIVVAVVVTYFTAGAAGTYFAGMQAAAAGTTAATVTGASVLTGASVASIGWSATLASAAIGGAAGSIASQAIGSAMGATSFSWRNVAAAGITTALTAGIGAGLQQVGAFTQGAKVAGQLNKIGQTVQGVAGYGASVVGQAATGQDAHFSWAAVAATAVGSALSANLGGKLPLTKGGTKSGRFLNDFEGYLVGGGSSATARRLFGLGEQDWGQVAMDAFGNAVGNTVIDGVVQAQAVKKLSAEGRAYYEDKIRNGADPHITLARAQHYETEGPSGFLNTGLWGAAATLDPFGLHIGENDLERARGTPGAIANLGLSPLAAEDDEHAYFVNIVFDGTMNNYPGMLDPTNPGIFAENLFATDGDRSFKIYESGVGTGDEGSIAGGAFGLGAKAREAEALDQLSTQMSDIYKRDPDARIFVNLVGFSRGAAESLDFGNIVEQGVPMPDAYDADGKQLKFEGDRAPRIGAMVLYDPVASFGLAGNDINLGFDLSIPETAQHVLEITAEGESRLFFPLTAAIDPAKAGSFYSDGRITQVSLPGVHSDIGGSYPNPYSYIALDAGYAFLQQLGVPLNPLTDYKAGYDFDATHYPASEFRTHDSSWGLDRVLHALGVHRNRTTYIHPGSGQ